MSEELAVLWSRVSSACLSPGGGAGDAGDAERAACRQAAAGAVGEGRAPLQALVAALAAPLTSEDDDSRAEATAVLAEATAAASRAGRLPAAQASDLVEFCVRRLEDLGTLRAALRLAAALISSPALPAEAAATLGVALVDVQVQGLTQEDRSAALAALAAFLRGHAAAAEGLGEHLAQGVCAAVDGERDPRCLLRAFELVGLAAVQLEPHAVEANAEELFDALSRYFPVRFTPPPGADKRPDAVTREQLVGGLRAAMLASPAFAAPCLALLLDKLDSLLHTSKMDSVDALAGAPAAFGAAAAPFAERVWTALRKAALPRAATGASEAQIAEAESADSATHDAARELREAACGCIAAWVAAEGALGKTFTNMVLEDGGVGGVAAAAAAADGEEGAPATPSPAAVAAAAAALQAAASGSAAAAASVVNRYAAGLAAKEGSAALGLLVAIVQGVRSAVETGGADVDTLLGEVAGSTLERFCADAQIDPSVSAATVAGGAAGLEALCCARCDSPEERARRTSRAASALAACLMTSAGGSDSGAVTARAGALGAMRNVATSSDEGAGAVAAAVASRLIPAATSAVSQNRLAALGALGELAGVAPTVWEAIAGPLATGVRQLIGEGEGNAQALVAAEDALQCLHSQVLAAENIPRGHDALLGEIAITLLGCGGDIARSRPLARAVRAAVARADASVQLRLLPSVADGLLRSAVPCSPFLASAAAACAMRQEIAKSLLEAIGGAEGAASMLRRAVEAAPAVAKRSDREAAACAMVVASVLNKLPAGSCLDGCAAAALQVLAESSSRPQSVPGVVALGWVGKALVMRGGAHSSAATTELLTAVLGGEGDSEGAIDEARAAACATLGLVVSEPHEALSTGLHAQAAFLYKQRFLTAVVPSLIEAARDSAAALLALCHALCSGTLPESVVLQHATRAFPLALGYLPRLVEGADVGDRTSAALAAQVMSVARVIMTADAGKEVVATHASKLIGAALGALSIRGRGASAFTATAARGQALETLRVAAEAVPWSALYPLRASVCAALDAALDDDARAVRRAAVAAKDAWEDSR